jgi:AraC family transcriptional regulator of adaptative response/methylated-DNA-[protein]-cysteine methyltransferase
MKKADGLKNSFVFPAHVNARLFAAKKSTAGHRIGQSTLITTKTMLRNPQKITFTVADSSEAYGPILVAQTAKGICALLLGGKERSKWDLQKDLIRRFPKSVLRQSREGDQQQLLETIGQYLDRPSMNTGDSPELDLQGTPFQQNIWKAIRQIPAGKVETYSQLAQRAGVPLTSARAVANACGQNHIALLIPCHRIVRTNGDVGGYHWGTDIKRNLLAKEEVALG